MFEWKKKWVDARNDHQTEGAAKANIFCFRIACSVCSICATLGFFIARPGELSLGSTMAAESSTMPVGVGGDAEDAGLVESDRQGDGVSGVDGGERYAEEGLW